MTQTALFPQAIRPAREIVDHLPDLGQALLPRADVRAMLVQLASHSPGLILCATGHRPQDIPGYQDRDFPVLVFIAERWLRRLKPAVVIVGGAIGWDQAVAQAALHLGLTTIVAVPFLGQHRRWREADQRRYGEQILAADSAYACFSPNLDKTAEVRQALLGRNIEMLRYSHSVLAFSAGRTEGGTAACLRNAHTRGIPVAGNAFADWEAYQAGQLSVIHEVRRSPLSNFAPVQIRMRGEVYGSVEHAYQAAKTEVAAERGRIRQTASPAEARKMGRTVTLREGWDELRLPVMAGLLQQKFAQATYRDALLATGEALILEGNTWNDTFFGVCHGVGHNHLGRLLMELRQGMQA